MKKVFVTGASGFIGRHCLAFLSEKGYEVHAVHYGDPSAMIPVKNVQWHVLDLTQEAKAKQLMTTLQPSHWIHLAWYTNHKDYWTSLQNFEWVRLSLALLEHFHSLGGIRVVMAGTCAEYDWSRPGMFSEDKTPLKSKTMYGASRHALQSMVHAFCSYKGLSYAWGRIFFVYGPGEFPQRLVPAVIRSLLNNEDVDCSHGKQKRDFLYVKDVARAFVALLESPVQGPVNIGSGKAVSLRTMIEKMMHKIGHGEKVHFGAKPSPQGEPALIVADTKRLQRELRWTPQTSLDQGLDETIQWWKERLKLK